MTDRPTPETDALLRVVNEGRVYTDVGPVAQHARKLERERDQAMEIAREALKPFAHSFAHSQDHLCQEKERIRVREALKQIGEGA